MNATKTAPNELETLRAQLAAAQAQLAAAQKARPITAKVAEKGGISVYGLGRFPVTLYESQWETVLGGTVEAKVRECIQANRSLIDARTAAAKEAKANA